VFVLSKGEKMKNFFFLTKKKLYITNLI